MKLTFTTTGSEQRLSDRVNLPIKCPHCSHKFPLKIAGLKSDPLLTCPSCGNKVQIESGGTVQKTADELAKLDRAWSNLFKK